MCRRGGRVRRRLDGARDGGRSLRAARRWTHQVLLVAYVSFPPFSLLHFYLDFAQAFVLELIYRSYLSLCSLASLLIKLCTFIYKWYTDILRLSLLAFPFMLFKFENCCQNLKLILPSQKYNHFFAYLPFQSYLLWHIIKFRKIPKILNIHYELKIVSLYCE